MEIYKIYASVAIRQNVALSMRLSALNQALL